MSQSKEWRPDYFDNLVAFLSDPSDQRTNKQFAEANGITEDTVYRYKREHGSILWPCVDTSRATYTSVIRSAAFRAVFANIKSSFNDRKLALQLTGDLVEQTKSTVELKTPEEKRALINEVLEKLSKRIEQTPKNTDKI